MSWSFLTHYRLKEGWQVDYASQICKNLFCNIDLAAKKHKVLWEDSRLPFDHVPFVVVNHKVYDCQHGVDRHLSEKRKNQAVRWKYLYLNDFADFLFCVD